MHGPINIKKKYNFDSINYIITDLLGTVLLMSVIFIIVSSCLSWYSIVQ